MRWVRQRKKQAYLSIEEEDPSFPRKIPVANKVWESKMEEDRFAALSVGLDEKRPDGDVVNYATKATF